MKAVNILFVELSRNNEKSLKKKNIILLIKLYHINIKLIKIIVIQR